MYASHAMTAVVVIALGWGGLVQTGPAADPSGPGAQKNPYGYGVWTGKAGAAPQGNGGTHSGGGGGGSTGPDCTIVPGPYPTMAVCGGNGAPYGLTLPATQAAAAPAVTPAQLAAFAFRHLAIPQPTINTAPPRGHDGLVGLPEFYWADPATWHSLNARATAGGLWAEVTATPTQLVIASGDGSSLTCQGPGTPYDPSRSPDAQNTGCTHLYLRSSAGLPGSACNVTAHVIWTATWVGSGGSGGTLPPTTRTDSFPLRVAEAQALVQRSS